MPPDRIERLQRSVGVVRSQAAAVALFLAYQLCTLPDALLVLDA